MNNMQNSNDYSLVVKLHGNIVLDGRVQPKPKSQPTLCWSENFSDCVPYVSLPLTPIGNDPYSSYEFYPADCCDPDETELPEDPMDRPVYWPTLQDWMDGTNGVPGTVTVDDRNRIVVFDFR